MATHDEIGLSQPAASTTTHRLDAISLDKNSTTVLREVMVLGSPETTNALAAVLNAAPASTDWGLVVRDVAASTTVNVSSLAGAVTVRSSAANALVTVYQSSIADLQATVAQASTVWQVQARLQDSSGAGLSASTAAPATGDNGLVVRQVGYTAPSTTVNVSSLAGAVTVRSSAANALVSVYQSTAADLNVTVAGYSTTANVSSVAGRVGTMPFSTLWASCGGFTFDSSGALQITGASASTQVAVSSLAGTVTVTPTGTSNSSIYFPVRLTNGTAFLPLAQDYLHGSTLTASTVAGPVSMLRANSTIPPAVSTSDMFVAPWGTLHGALNVSVVTSSGASIMDSTNTALKVNVVAGAAGGSTIVTVSTGSVRVHQSTAADLNVTVAGYSTTVNVSSLAGAVIMRSSAADALVTVYQSTYTAFNTLSRLADRDASTAVAAIVNATQPASTAYGLVVRFPAPFADSTNDAIKVNVVAGAAGGSTIVTVSTGSVRVHQSTAADLNVTVAGYSTTVNVSSLAGAVITRSSAADALVTVYQSTASALNATVVPGSTTWTVQTRTATSSGGALEGSTAAPAQGVLGLHVRQAFSSCQSTTALFTSSNSTAVYAVIASAAGMRYFVSAYAVFASTSGSPSTLVFMSSLAIDRWSVGLSSGFSGANMAVSQPGWIFRTDAQNALNLRIESASTAVAARVSLSWFTEP